MSADLERVRGVEGIELALHRWSHGGVALLFLHGYDNDSHVWDAFTPDLAPHYQTLALDHRGHGRSAWDPRARYDPETLAHDVEAVLAHLGLERVVLVGHSLGGRVALHFARRAAQRLAGLVLVDVGPELDLRGVQRIRMDRETVEPSFASLDEFEGVLSVRYPATNRDTLARLARHWLRRRDDGRYETRTDPAFGGTRAGRSESATRAWSEAQAKILWETLGRIPCPSLVVRGAASDILDPDVAERMAEEVLPDGRLAVIPRAGHSVMLDNPEAFREVLSGFVLGDG
ncbi:MAG: alpha/beta fold hydrolase [Myxococcota bacterium]